MDQTTHTWPRTAHASPLSLIMGWNPQVSGGFESTWGRKAGSLGLQIPPAPTILTFVFSSLTLKLPLHPHALPWVLPQGTKNLEVF
jgi:hypothetical protein